jgi:hypothetical protein
MMFPGEIHYLADAKNPRGKRPRGLEGAQRYHFIEHITLPNALVMVARLSATLAVATWLSAILERERQIEAARKQDLFQDGCSGAAGSTAEGKCRDIPA